MTDLSKVSDGQLSKVIAEFLEPVGTEAPKCWRIYMLAIQLDVWEPRNMVNDATMTVMLMEKLSNTYIVRIDTLESGHVQIAYEADLETGTCDWLTECGSLGRAVAEAFALANKLEIE
jgi:hypothetical protein